MKFYALVKQKPEYDPNDHYHFISSDYDYPMTKKEFLSELRRNGYVVWHNKAYTEDEYNNI